MMNRFLFLIFFCCINLTTHANVMYPRVDGSNEHFLYFKYKDNSIYNLKIYHATHPLVIYLNEDENISTLYSSNPENLKIVNDTDKIFIKSLKPNTKTNLTILTSDDRKYFFEIISEEFNEELYNQIPFVVRFDYPFVGTKKDLGKKGKNKISDSIIKISLPEGEPDLTDPEKLKSFNFNYTVSGNDESIMPTKIFDDQKGKLYLEFDKPNPIIPAVFGVRDNGTEYIVNSKRVGKYMVVSELPKIATLRYNSSTVCIFNEKMLSEAKNDSVKKKPGFFERLFK